MPGLGGVLKDGEATGARGRWARERWPEVATERAASPPPLPCGGHCGVQGRHLGILSLPASEMDGGGLDGGAELEEGAVAAALIGTLTVVTALFFFFFWLRWVFFALRGLLIVVASLCCGARAPGAWASVIVARGLGICGMRAQ